MLFGDITLPISFYKDILVVLSANTSSQGGGIDNAFAYSVDLHTIYYATKNDNGDIRGFPGACMAIGR